MRTALDAASEDWILYGFELVPGDNVITTNVPINIVYRTDGTKEVVCV